MKNRNSKREIFNPFTLVIFLSIICVLFGINALNQEEESLLKNIPEVLIFWKEGFFSLLGFTLQMMMILVFGYCLAVFKPIHLTLKKMAAFPKGPTQSVLFVGMITMFAGIVNWGFGLIVGALLARFVTLSQEEKGLKPNPALLASAGYLGMAVWHGGLSGSAPLKVAESGHFLEEVIGVIPISETIFTSFNVFVLLGLVFVYLFTLVILSKRVKTSTSNLRAHPLRPIPFGSEDYLGRVVGVVIILVAFLSLLTNETSWYSLDLNTVNFLLFGLTLIVYRSLPKFTEAVGEGIKSSTDIFIQFPFYAGILGVLASTGALYQLSQYVIANASAQTLPLYTLISSAFVNVLVPSGGGQWAVQGPILMDASKAFDLPLSKMVLVFSYGDQLTNLLQPFWALPLLSITGVSARDILKYTFWLFLTSAIYLISVVIFFI